MKVRRGEKCEHGTGVCVSRAHGLPCLFLVSVADTFVVGRMVESRILTFERRHFGLEPELQ